MISLRLSFRHCAHYQTRVFQIRISKTLAIPARKLLCYNSSPCSSSASSISTPPDFCRDVCCSGCQAGQHQHNGLVPGTNSVTLDLPCSSSIAETLQLSLSLERAHCSLNRLTSMRMYTRCMCRKNIDLTGCHCYLFLLVVNFLDTTIFT